MSIQSAKPSRGQSGFLVTLDDGSEVHVPNDPSNRHRVMLQAWLDDGNTLGPADPLPPPPTNEEIYDRVLQTNKVLKGLVKSINDGTLVTGANLTGPQVRAIIKNNM